MRLGGSSSAADVGPGHSKPSVAQAAGSLPVVWIRVILVLSRTFSDALVTAEPGGTARFQRERFALIALGRDLVVATCMPQSA